MSAAEALSPPTEDGRQSTGVLNYFFGKLGRSQRSRAASTSSAGDSLEQDCSCWQQEGWRLSRRSLLRLIVRPVLMKACQATLSKKLSRARSGRADMHERQRHWEARK